MKFVFRTPALLLLGLMITTLTAGNAQGTSFLPGDSGTYFALYEGNGGKTLSYNNSNANGNLGIGATGKFQGNGPGTINGAVNFSAPNTGQFSNSGLTITGGDNYNVANVQTDLNALN